MWSWGRKCDSVASDCLNWGSCEISLFPLPRWWMTELQNSVSWYLGNQIFLTKKSGHFQMFSKNIPYFYQKCNYTVLFYFNSTLNECDWEDSIPIFNARPHNHGKIHWIWSSDIFKANIRIPDKVCPFATLVDDSVLQQINNNTCKYKARNSSSI